MHETVGKLIFAVLVVAGTALASNSPEMDVSVRAQREGLTLWRVAVKSRPTEGCSLTHARPNPWSAKRTIMTLPQCREFRSVLTELKSQLKRATKSPPVPNAEQFEDRSPHAMTEVRYELRVADESFEISESELEVCSKGAHSKIEDARICKRKVPPALYALLQKLKAFAPAQAEEPPRKHSEQASPPKHNP